MATKFRKDNYTHNYELKICLTALNTGFKCQTYSKEHKQYKPSKPSENCSKNCIGRRNHSSEILTSITTILSSSNLKQYFTWKFYFADAFSSLKTFLNYVLIVIEGVVL